MKSIRKDKAFFLAILSFAFKITDLPLLMIKASTDRLLSTRNIYKNILKKIFKYIL